MTVEKTPQIATPAFIDALEQSAQTIARARVEARRATESPEYRAANTKSGLYFLGTLAGFLSLVPGSFLAGYITREESNPNWMTKILGVAVVAIPALGALFSYMKHARTKPKDMFAPVAESAKRELAKIFGKSGKKQIYVRPQDFPRLKTALQSIRSDAQLAQYGYCNDDILAENPLMVKKSTNPGTEDLLQLRIGNYDNFWTARAFKLEKHLQSTR